MGLTLFYGIIVAIPAILISGILFGSTVKRYTTLPNQSLIAPDLADEQMPSTAVSFLTVLLPILLISLSTVLNPFLPDGSWTKQAILFAGEPVVSMLISVVVAMLTLGTQRGKSMTEVTDLLASSIKDVAMLFLIFGGAGGLKQVLTDGELLAASLRAGLGCGGHHPRLRGFFDRFGYYNGGVCIATVKCVGRGAELNGVEHWGGQHDVFARQRHGFLAFSGILPVVDGRYA